MKSITERVITWPGAYNMRWITNNFIRSANLDLVTAEGWSKFLSAGVHTVIDLRNADEKGANSYKAPGAINVLSIPFFSTWDASGKTHAIAKSRGHEYFLWLEKFGDSILNVLTAMAEAESRVLFHCQTGTDRTGVIAALVLANFGDPPWVREISPYEIIEDYAASHQQMVDYGSSIGQDWSGMPESKRTTMEEMLRNVNSKYGSVGRYLTSIGVTDYTKKWLNR